MEKGDIEILNENQSAALDRLSGCLTIDLENRCWKAVIDWAEAEILIPSPKITEK